MITDANGTPISDSNSFESLTSYSIVCDTFSGDPGDELEGYSPGESGLQYMGDGHWQFNWKTSKGFAGTCRIMVLRLADGSEQLTGNGSKSISPNALIWHHTTAP